MDPRYPRRAGPAPKAMSKLTIVAALALLVAIIIIAAALVRRERAPTQSPVSVASPDKGEPPGEPAPPPLPVSPATKARARTSEGGRADPPPDQQSLLSRLRDLAASDPPRSLALAREALARFPRSADAPEFQWNIVKALANMDRYREAEQEARAMLERFPGNPFSDDVEHHLLNRPPNPQDVPGP